MYTWQPFSMCCRNSFVADSSSFSKVNHKRAETSRIQLHLQARPDTKHLIPLPQHTNTVGQRTPTVICVHAQLVFSRNRGVRKIPTLWFASYLLRGFHYQARDSLGSSLLLDIHSKSSTPVSVGAVINVPGNSPLQVCTLLAKSKRLAVLHWPALARPSGLVCETKTSVNLWTPLDTSFSGGLT